MRAQVFSNINRNVFCLQSKNNSNAAEKKIEQSKDVGDLFHFKKTTDDRPQTTDDYGLFLMAFLKA